jgi:hypothetical protein
MSLDLSYMQHFSASLPLIIFFVIATIALLSRR